MPDDLEEQPWFVFQMPHAVVYVPAETEKRARSALARNQYKDAPVDSYPHLMTRYTSRQLLTQELLRKANADD